MFTCAHSQLNQNTYAISYTLYACILHHDGMIKLHSKVQGQSFFSVMINTAIIEIHMQSIPTCVVNVNHFAIL